MKFPKGDNYFKYLGVHTNQAEYQVKHWVTLL